MRLFCSVGRFCGSPVACDEMVNGFERKLTACAQDMMQGDPRRAQPPLLSCRAIHRLGAAATAMMQGHPPPARSRIGCKPIEVSMGPHGKRRPVLSPVARLASSLSPKHVS